MILFNIKLSDDYLADLDGFKKEFRAQVEADIAKCMAQLGEYSQQLLDKSIDSQLYGSISGHYATGSIRGAHQLDINGMGFELYMDPGKMTEVSPLPNRFKQDWYGKNTSNIPSGASYSEELLEGFNEGGIGASIFRNYRLPETRYFEHAFEQIQENAAHKLASLLRGMGYNVTVS